ncbi:hypothetical protein [Sphingomonas molluscorum]|uniref:hypothetical protein n=1 Tax=Sphingomonas molluscorum TaxID=418184 RepID=UPI0031DB965A
MAKALPDTGPEKRSISDPPSSATVLRTLADASTPKHVPADMSKHAQLAMMVVKPDRLVGDNLSAYHGRHVEDSARELSIDVDFTGAERPRDKSDMERLIGVILDLGFKGVAAAVDPIALRRHTKNDPPADQLPTLADLRPILDRAVAVLNVSPTDALMGRSPLSFYLQKLNERKVNIIKDLAKFRRAIGCVEYDVELRASGIEIFKGLRYVQKPRAASLFDKLRHRERPSKKTKVASVPVKVKYDPGDLGRIHVWDPVDKVYVTFECDAPEYADRLPKWVHDLILADIAEDELAFCSPETLVEYRARLFERQSDITQAAGEDERRRAARLTDTAIFQRLMGEIVEVLDENEYIVAESVSHDTRYRNVVTISEAEELDVEELARVIRVDVGEIEARRYVALEKGRLSFFGLTVAGAAIEKKARRFSPASLKTSPHIRAIWELKDLPFCPESWELLVDTCLCGVRQGWIRLNGVHRCDDCGRPLARTPARIVPEALQAGLALVAGLASPLPAVRAEALGLLPPALREADRNDLYRCITRLRQCVTGGSVDVDHELEALHSACQALLTWPLGIQALAPAATMARSGWRAAVVTYERMVPSRNRTDEHDRGSLTNPMIKAARPRGTWFGSARSPMIGIRPAYELARLESETLMAGRARGHLGAYEHMRGTRLVPVFDPEEVLGFADAIRSRVSAGTIAYRFGIGRRAVQEIADHGHMSASGLRLDDEVWFTEQDVSDFLRRMSDAGRSLIEHPTRIRKAMLSIHGRPKPWAAVIGAMLDGRLPFSIADREAKLFDTISIAGADVTLLSEMAPAIDIDTFATERLTQREAQEILNIGANCHALDALAREGRNPITFLLADVLRLGRVGISVLEAAALTGRSASHTYHLIRRAGIDAVADGLWDRRQVTNRILGSGI